MTIERNYQALQEAVFLRRPGLGEVLRRHGHESVARYAETLRINEQSTPDSRKEEFIGEVAQAAKGYFGEATGASVARQLRHYYYVSTTDHLGILNHPFFINGDIMSALPYVGGRDTNHENTIVLACGNISLNNSSWPRSLFCHLPNSLGAEEVRFNFFSASDHLSPVFRFRAINREDVGKFRQKITTGCRQQKYSGAIATKLESVLTDVYDQPQILERTYFSEQLALTNSLLWQRFFSASETALPHLIYLQQEDIVLNLLKKYHLTSPTELHAFIFDADISRRIVKLFAGIPGAFSTAEHKGTYLFWYFPSHSRVRIPLQREGDDLVSFDGAHRIPLIPEKIKALIESRELIPSMMLCLVTLAGYYGVKCLGGFSQVDYLGKIMRAYKELFGLASQEQDKAFSQGFCGELILGTVVSDKKLVPATGLDFILCNDTTSFREFCDNAQRITLREAVNLMMPEFYRILYREGERRSDIMAIDHETISSLLGLDGRLVPSLRLTA